MVLTYNGPHTTGLLRMLLHEAHFERQFFRDRKERLLTIALNTGPVQLVTVDGVEYSFPNQTILPLMVNQSFTFSQPADVIAWQFNRDFYCIVDHDREVSCVGFLFYGNRDLMRLRLDETEKARFNALVQVFIDEFSTKDNIQGEMLRMLLKRLVIKLTRLAREQYIDPALSENDLDIVRRFNLLVEQHYRSQHTVSYYAEQLNRSPKTLANLFALYNQQSPLQAIHGRLATEAKRLLRYTDKSTKEICFELGFTEVPHFSRFFKKQTGVPTTDFREELITHRA